MKANRAYKFRIYPNTLQKESFAKTFGCVRFIYNKMLSDKIDYYKETGKMLINTPAQYKKEFEFLKDVDSLALSNAQLQLQAAYKNFFRDKSVGFPKFKSKKYSRQSYTTNLVNGNIKIMNGKIRLPKVGEIRILLTFMWTAMEILPICRISTKNQKQSLRESSVNFLRWLKEATTITSRKEKLHLLMKKLETVGMTFSTKKVKDFLMYMTISA